MGSEGTEGDGSIGIPDPPWLPVAPVTAMSLDMLLKVRFWIRSIAQKPSYRSWVLLNVIDGNEQARYMCSGIAIRISKLRQKVACGRMMHETDGLPRIPFPSAS